ncbi:MAG: ATP synthase F1 subunit epsilon [Bacteriovoracaceae bacterium]|nr:ATP synthase F1 subunit epsilon [Bacteriovoracaceae bacterium]
MLTFDLFTPNGALAKKISCTELSIPTVMGQIGIFTGHEHLLSQLDSGVLVCKGEYGIQRFFVSHGICKVVKDHVTVLATTAETESQVNMERAQKALKNADQKLVKIDQLSQDDLTKQTRKQARARGRILLAHGKTKDL